MRAARTVRPIALPSLVAAVAVVAALIGGPGLAGPAVASAPERSTYIAKLRDPGAPGLDAAVERSGGRVVRRYHHFPFAAIDATPAEAARLARSPRIEAMAPSRTLTPALVDSVPLIEADQVHQLDLLGGQYKGAGTMVAVIDNGVDTSHDVFAGKTILEACFAPSGFSCPNGQTGPGAAEPDCTPVTDACSHGTNVAGIAVGAGDLSIGEGVAPEADLLAVNVFGTAPFAGTDSILAGLEHVLDLTASQPIVAANMSLQYDIGSASYCDFLDADTELMADALQALFGAGVVTTVASGNHGAGANGEPAGVAFPACVSWAMSVGSTLSGPDPDADAVVSEFTDSAPILSLLAPGQTIFSAAAGGGSIGMAGTSQAAPHAAGAVALLAEAFGGPAVWNYLALVGSGLPLTDPERGTFPRLRTMRAFEGTGVWSDSFTPSPALVGGNDLGVAGLLAETSDAPQPGEPNHAGGTGGRSVWFRWTAPKSGKVTIDTRGSSFDTVLAVYKGSAVDNLDLVASDDDISASNRDSEVSFKVAGDSTYRIAVDGHDAGDLGAAIVNLSLSSPPVPHGDSPGVRRGNELRLRNYVSAGFPDQVYTFGKASDVGFVGDWNGDGIDTAGVRRGTTWMLRNSHSSGAPSLQFTYGLSTDQAVVGDWDGDGRTEVGVRRGNQFRLRKVNSSGPAQIVFTFGKASDKVIVGDWDDDGVDEIGLRRGTTFLFRNTLTTGPATSSFTWGKASDVPVAGDWNDDGRDTVGLRRGATWYLRNKNANLGPAWKSFVYGLGSDKPLVGNWDGK